MGYIPRQEAKLLTWAQNFAGRLAADPERYGLTAADTDRCSAAVETFVAAYASATATRSPAAVAAKNTASQQMQQVLRALAMPIKHRRGISDADKINLGLRLNTRQRRRIAAPTSFPIVSLREGQPLRHILQFTDSAAEGGRKPPGAQSLELHYCLSDSPAPLPAPGAANLPGRLAGLCTRPTFTMTFKAAEVGKTVHYWARWQTRTGKPGPWSAVLRISVMG